MKRYKTLLLISSLVVGISMTGCASKEVEVNPYQVQKTSSNLSASTLTELDWDEAMVAHKYITTGNDTIFSIAKCVDNISQNIGDTEVARAEATQMKSLAVIGRDIFYMKDDIPYILEDYVSCFIDIMNETIVFSEELQKNNQDNFMESAKKITELMNKLTNIMNGLS